MSLVRIENQTDLTFIINSLKITLCGQNSSSGRSYAMIDENELSNSEIRELINGEYIAVENATSLPNASKADVIVKSKRKYTKRIPKNPEVVVNEMNSEVVVATRNGIEKKRMVADATADKGIVYVKGYEPDRIESIKKPDPFIDKVDTDKVVSKAKKGRPPKVAKNDKIDKVAKTDKVDDDSFIEI